MNFGLVWGEKIGIVKLSKLYETYATTCGPQVVIFKHSSLLHEVRFGVLLYVYVIPSQDYYSIPMNVLFYGHNLCVKCNASIKSRECFLIKKFELNYKISIIPLSLL